MASSTPTAEPVLGPAKGRTWGPGSMNCSSAVELSRPAAGRMCGAFDQRVDRSGAAAGRHRNRQRGNSCGQWDAGEHVSEVVLRIETVEPLTTRRGALPNSCSGTGNRPTSSALPLDPPSPSSRPRAPLVTIKRLYHAVDLSAFRARLFQLGKRIGRNSQIDVRIGCAVIRNPQLRHILIISDRPNARRGNPLQPQHAPRPHSPNGTL